MLCYNMDIPRVEYLCPQYSPVNCYHMCQVINILFYLCSGMSSSVVLHAGYLDVKTKGRLGDVSSTNMMYHVILCYQWCVNMLALSPTLYITSKQCHAWKEMVGSERSQWFSNP